MNTKQNVFPILSQFFQNIRDTNTGLYYWCSLIEFELWTLGILEQLQAYPNRSLLYSTRHGAINRRCPETNGEDYFRSIYKNTRALGYLIRLPFSLMLILEKVIGGNTD